MQIFLLKDVCELKWINISKTYENVTKISLIVM